MKLADEQPDNVCFDCGDKWGSHPIKNGENHRVWIDQCDVCLKLKNKLDLLRHIREVLVRKLV